MMRILVADDEMLVMEGIKILIPSVNVECQIVECVGDGDSAWKYVSENPIDVLITDIRMPGLSGLRLIEKCKEVHPNIISIIISGYCEFEYAKSALNLGVVAYIDKPITREKLQDALFKAENIFYKQSFVSNHQEYMLHKCDKLIQLQFNHDYEEMQLAYEDIKNQLHKERWPLSDYKRYMYMLTMFVSGAYYEISGDEYAQRHYPSYKNMYFFETIEEVNAYADTFMKGVLDKLYARKNGSMHVMIRKLVDYISVHYGENIGLEELAGMMGISSVYLSSLFKDELGISYIKYLTNIRIKKAQELLVDGKYSIAEVSEMVGYPNYRYFCDLFKKNTGQTPTEYKGNIRKGREEK